MPSHTLCALFLCLPCMAAPEHSLKRSSGCNHFRGQLDHNSHLQVRGRFSWEAHVCVLCVMASSCEAAIMEYPQVHMHPDRVIGRNRGRDKRSRFVKLKTHLDPVWCVMTPCVTDIHTHTHTISLHLLFAFLCKTHNVYRLCIKPD